MEWLIGIQLLGWITSAVWYFHLLKSPADDWRKWPILCLLAGIGGMAWVPINLCLLALRIQKHRIDLDFRHHLRRLGRQGMPPPTWGRTDAEKNARKVDQENAAA